MLKEKKRMASVARKSSAVLSTDDKDAALIPFDGSRERNQSSLYLKKGMKNSAIKKTISSLATTFNNRSTFNKKSYYKQSGNTKLIDLSSKQSSSLMKLSEQIQKFKEAAPPNRYEIKKESKIGKGSHVAFETAR